MRLIEDIARRLRELLDGIEEDIDQSIKEAEKAEQKIEQLEEPS